MVRNHQEQKEYAWLWIVIGCVLSITIIGIVIGIPLIIYGILLLKGKVENPPLLNWIINQRLTREKLEKRKKN